MSRRRENCPNVNLTVIERARAIYHRNYDAYKRIVATNEKMADMLGVTERSVMSANAEPLKTSGWQVLILMAQIELEEERRKTYDDYRMRHIKEEIKNAKEDVRDIPPRRC